MTTLQNLIDIKALAANIDAKAGEAILALDDEPTVPPEPAPFQKWAVPQYVLAGESGYVCEPLLIECQNGDILCMYRHGTAHLSVGGKLKIRRSTNRGKSFGEPSIMYELTGRDCRNHSLGIDPDTGRLISFSRTADNANVTYDRMKHISDDDGATWTTSVFTGLSAYPTHVPFGPMVKTSNGLCQLFYQANSIIAVFSNDGFDTVSGTATVFQHTQTSAVFAEPTIVAIDENRIVIVIRDNVDGGRYWFIKSSDGLATCTGATQGRWTSTTGLQAAPANIALHGETVFFSFDTRSPNWSQFVTKVEKEAFFANPLTAWAIGSVVPGTIRTYTSKIAGGNASGAEYGYVNQLSLAEGVLHAHYDSKAGNGYIETCILCSS